ncbi:hypothetical protein EDC96DRAFT_589825 [Choanephora cucurbitarum]|nr:hypothetical protein EDC96DRAFT_589825 [Choanephora cucurbitarum]
MTIFMPLCFSLMLFSYALLLCSSLMLHSYALFLCSTLMLHSYAPLLCSTLMIFSYAFLLCSTPILFLFTKQEKEEGLRSNSSCRNNFIRLCKWHLLLNYRKLSFDATRREGSHTTVIQIVEEVVHLSFY